MSAGEGLVDVLDNEQRLPDNLSIMVKHRSLAVGVQGEKPILFGALEVNWEELERKRKSKKEKRKKDRTMEVSSLEHQHGPRQGTGRIEESSPKTGHYNERHPPPKSIISKKQE